MKTILYILGYGRSGSTLLINLLNSHPQILSAGELYWLPNELISNNLPKYCGCGVLFNKCNVWNNIFEQTSELDLHNISFSEWNMFLFEKLNKIKRNASVIVDSSCNIKRFYNLKNSNISNQISLKTIYLSRDSRGVIYSASNKGYGIGDNLYKQPILRAIGSWYIRNRQYLNIFNNTDKNLIIHIKYEDLVTNTSKILMDIHNFINIEPKIFESNWKKNPPHTFRGNIGLIRSNSSHIVHDKSWVNGLTKIQLFMIELVTGRLNKILLNSQSDLR